MTSLANEHVARLVSSRTGLIKSVAPMVRGLIDPTPPYIYTASLADYSSGSEPNFDVAGVGKGRTPERAVQTAIGEAVERYCSAQYRNVQIIRASRAELDSTSLDPEDCVLYSSRQYATGEFHYSPFSKDTTLSWVNGFKIGSSGNRESVIVPAISVYLVPTWERHEEHLFSPTSNGTAAGEDLDSALLNGLYELIERDAFLVSWLTRRPCPSVDFMTDGGISATVAKHYARYNIELRIIDLSLDTPVSVMLAIALDHTNAGPAAMVGLGASLSPREAVDKAVLEICQARPGEASKFLLSDPDDRIRSFADVNDLMDHSALFHNVEMVKELSFLLDGKCASAVEELTDHSTGSPEGDLQLCVSALEAVGSEVVGVDITTPDVMSVGLRVVRVIATHLQPIHFGHGEERLGGHRLFNLPAQLGYASRQLTEDDLNPCPHPLA